MDGIPEFVVIPLLLVAALFFLAMAFWSRYKTVSPDEAMIVTGTFLGNKNVLADDTGRSIKIVRGGGAFILPIFQKQQRVSLLSHKLDITTPEVYTEQGVPIMVDGVAIIKIGGTVEDVATAAEQFLGKPTQELRIEAQEVLEGHLRAILGTMTVEEVYKNRDKFAQEVQAVAAKDLKKMGLQVVSFTIKDVRDKEGYLDALGRPRIAAVKRDAEVAEAEAMRDARIRKAEAEENAMKAELLRDTNIAESGKEKELKIASFKREQDQAKAEADQSYSIQEAKSLQVVTEEQMKVDVVRKNLQIELEEKEIQRRERQYDAEVKKKADADRYAVEQAAEANKVRRMREADAQQYQIEASAKAEAEQKRLDGVAKADAERAQGTADADVLKLKGLAEADAERAKGTASAEVIKLKGLAEAEAKEKLAEAFDKYGQAAVIDILAKMLPEFAGRIAEPMQHIDKLTVVDTGSGEGAARVSNYVTTLMAQSGEMLKNVSGIDLESLVKGIAEKYGAGNSGAKTARHVDLDNNGEGSV